MKCSKCPIMRECGGGRKPCPLVRAIKGVRDLLRPMSQDFFCPITSIPPICPDNTMCEQCDDRKTCKTLGRHVEGRV